MTENTISKTNSADDSTAKVYVKRNQMYVKRQFQQSMLLQALLITFIIINVIVMAFFWAIDLFADQQQMKIYLAWTIAALEVVGFVTLYRMNLRASHRIAGPIFSMERCLQQIENGDLTSRLQLRKTDNFPETAAQLNTAVNTLRCKINKAQYLADQIQRQPEQAEQLSQQLVDELSYFNTTTNKGEV